MRACLPTYRAVLAANITCAFPPGGTWCGLGRRDRGRDPPGRAEAKRWGTTATSRRALGDCFTTTDPVVGLLLLQTLLVLGRSCF